MSWRAIWISVSCVLIIVAIGGIFARSGTSGDPDIVTATRPLTVAIHPSDVGADGRQNLDVTVTGFQPPSNGAVTAVVKLLATSGRNIEVGRFTVGHSGRFTETLDATEAIQQLAAAGALSPNLKAQISLVPLRGSAAGASLSIGSVELVRR